MPGMNLDGSMDEASEDDLKMPGYALLQGGAGGAGNQRINKMVNEPEKAQTLKKRANNRFQ